jgi:hypothetical protein
VESCSGRSARKNIEPVYDPDTGRLRQLRYDSNAEFYQADLPTCAEEDTDGDGVIDKWEFYEAGRLASVAFDSMHRGRPGRRLTYSADGSVRIEVDPHGTGRWSPEKK